MKKKLFVWLLCAALLCTAVCGIAEACIDEIEIAEAEAALEVIEEEAAPDEIGLVEAEEEAAEEDGFLLAPEDGENEELTFELPDEELGIPEVPEDPASGTAAVGGGAKKVSAKAVTAEPEAQEADEEIIEVRDWAFGYPMSFSVCQVGSDSGEIVFYGWEDNGEWDLVRFYDGKTGEPVATANASDKEVYAVVKPGNHAFYMRYCDNASGGPESINWYSDWSRPVKLSVSVKWMSIKPQITGARQVDEDMIVLSWTAVPEAEGYYLYETNSIGKMYYIDAIEAPRCEYAVDTTWGKHQFVVVAYRRSDVLRIAECGKYSAVKKVTVQQLWAQQPKVTVFQNSENHLELEWAWPAAECDVYVKCPGASRYVFLTTDYRSCIFDEEVAVGKTYQFKVVPRRQFEDKVVYGKAKTVSYKAAVPWKAAPYLYVHASYHADHRDADLEWNVAEPASYYAIYEVKNGRDVLLGELPWKEVKTSDWEGTYTLHHTMTGKSYTFRVEPVEYVRGKRLAGNKSAKTTVRIDP